MKDSDLLTRVRRAVMRIVFGPHLRPTTTAGLVHLGSDYGGWTFVDLPSLENSHLVSCGLGEDASFDVLFCSRYHATAVIYDPTPRAIAHFQELTSRLGQGQITAFSDSGHQQVESYDLRSIEKGQLRFHPLAISDKAGVARFFAPPNPSNVSHSLVNFLNDYSQNSDFIEVSTVSLVEVVAEQPAASILKLDIEGAEIPALLALMDSIYRPGQILVEYDELAVASRRGRRNFRTVHSKILRAGYRLTFYDGRTCCSYLLNSIESC